MEHNAKFENSDTLGSGDRIQPGALSTRRRRTSLYTHNDLADCVSGLVVVRVDGLDVLKTEVTGAVVRDLLLCDVGSRRDDILVDGHARATRRFRAMGGMHHGVFGEIVAVGVVGSEASLLQLASSPSVGEELVGVKRGYVREDKRKRPVGVTEHAPQRRRA